MRIKTSTTGTLTKSDVVKIIQHYLELNYYKVDDISFDIRMEEDKDDYFASRPLQPVLKGVNFTIKSE